MRIACVLAEGFEDSEFRIPFDRFKVAGHEVVIVGAKKNDRIEGKGYRETVHADIGIEDARPERFDALFIPGGYSPDHLRGDERFVAFTRGFANKPIFAICHGPQLLLSANMVQGRTMTAWKTVQADLRHAGANVVDRDVCVDRALVTSRKPDDIAAFVRESLKQISNGAHAHARN